MGGSYSKGLFLFRNNLFGNKKKVQRDAGFGNRNPLQIPNKIDIYSPFSDPKRFPLLDLSLLTLLVASKKVGNRLGHCLNSRHVTCLLPRGAWMARHVSRSHSL